jgi:hypothetical protein
MVRAGAAVLAGLMTVTAGCGTSEVARRPSAAQLAGVNRLAVVVEGDSAFEVMVARVKAGMVRPVPVPAGGGGPGGAAAAFIASLAVLAISLGATAWIQGAAAAEDASTAATLRPQIQALSPNAAAVDTFTQALRSGGRFEVEVFASEPTEEQQRQVDAVVLLRFPTWGFQLLRTSLVAFVDVDARMVLAGRSESLWEQRETVFGRGRQTLDEIEADPELMRRELRDVLETAGYRLAVELQYPRGEP